MPYESGDAYETAQRLGHVPIIENELVQEELDGFSTKEVDPDEAPIEDNSYALEDLPNEGVEPSYFLSIDGSLQEVPTNDDYPSNRIGFVQIAAVLTKLDLLEEQQSERFVDPARVEELDNSSLQDIVLPSSNYVRDDAETTVESWRKHIYDTFKTREIEGRSLLEIYLDVIQADPRLIDENTVDVYRCPNPDCPSNSGSRRAEVHIHTSVDDFGNCPQCDTEVYPTDALRTHERVSESQSNRTAISDIMQVIEHLTMCAYLLYLSEENPERLSRVGFIIDGPLAIYGTGSFLHKPVLQTIARVSNRQKELGYAPPIIVGIEKSGQLKDHADQIKNEMEPGTVLKMDNEYIYKYIKNGTTDDDYGVREHYGWPFIYRTKSGRVFMIKVPKLPSGEEKYDPTNYPLMRKTLESLSKVETALYDDATIPVTLAHQRASIPLKTGSKVLELFSKGALNNGS